MRVPLDYYRILLLPVHADSSSVEQAYLSRKVQELWPGYSAETMDSRKRLLERAHDVLSDPQARDEYDKHLTVSESVLEVDPIELAAALAIQCENGEYQQALTGVQLALRQSPPAPDLLLTQAIARLHLGREEWANGDYDAAASMLQQALAELINHRVFPEVQAEVISDLSKLRPYRILKLLSHPTLSAPERQEGMSLLRSMLDERAGIEGSGEDGSELSTEDFLRFIQKTRSQMTIDEQQELFEGEAKRPSVVATYLAVYALIARGYVENRPALIRRARGYLVRLAQRHDVNLEQAICALLLGQPEEATRLLDRSKDTETIANIQQEADRSGGGDTDLLLGLCRYIESWLQQEVFPEYRDLDTSRASLRNYFDNPQVQQYLDEMPASSSDNEWFSRQIDGGSWPNAIPSSGASESPPPVPYPPIRQHSPEVYRSTETETGTGDFDRTDSYTGNTAPSAGYSSVTTTHPPIETEGSSPSMPPPSASQGLGSEHEFSTPVDSSYSEDSSVLAGLYPPIDSNDPDSSSEVGYGDEFSDIKRRQNSGTNLSAWLWRFGALAVVAILLFFGVRTLSSLFREPLEGPDEQPQLDIETPPVEVPEAVIPPAPPIDTTVLTTDVAKDAIESWQAAKQSALGVSRNLDSLGTVLAEPMLSQWQSRANALQQSNAYYTYTLRSVEVEEVAPSDTGDSGSVVVSISEAAEYFVNGVRQGGAASYDSTYRVRYNLVRVGDRWLVESFTTL